MVVHILYKCINKFIKPNFKRISSTSYIFEFGCQNIEAHNQNKNRQLYFNGLIMHCLYSNNKHVLNKIIDY